MHRVNLFIPDSIIKSVLEIQFREINAADYPFLREMLYQAVFVPPGHEPYDKSIIDLPEISKYIEGWNDSRDFGILCYNQEEQLGAIWGRLFTIHNKGYGFVDAETPELTMAVISDFRNHGIGTRLMQRFLQQARKKGYHSVSLSVDMRNRAFDFYKRMGFIIVEETNGSATMKKQL